MPNIIRWFAIPNEVFTLAMRIRVGLGPGVGQEPSGNTSAPNTASAATDTGTGTADAHKRGQDGLQWIQPGRMGTLVGLKGRSDLNGATCELLRLNEETGRWRVRCTTSGARW